MIILGSVTLNIYQEIATGNKNAVDRVLVETHNATSIHPFSTIVGIDCHQH